MLYKYLIFLNVQLIVFFYLLGHKTDFKTIILEQF